MIQPERKRVNPQPVVRVCAQESAFYLIAKRAMDLLLSILALAVLLPFLIVVAAVIYLDDPTGSPIFVQDRVGKNGKLFKFFNARSMLEAGYIAQKSGVLSSCLLCDGYKIQVDMQYQKSSCGTGLVREDTSENQSASMDIERIRGMQNSKSLMAQRFIGQSSPWPKLGLSVHAVDSTREMNNPAVLRMEGSVI